MGRSWLTLELRIISCLSYRGDSQPTAEPNQMGKNALQQDSRLATLLPEPVSVSRKKAASRPSPTERERISPEHWATFFEALAKMLESGMSIDESLGFLAESYDGHRRLKSIAGSLQKSVLKGLALSEGCIAPEFKALHVALIRCGEKSGNLPGFLKYLAEYEDSQAKLRRSILSTLAYPSFLLVGVCLFAVILPPFFRGPIEGVFASAQMQLPWTLASLFHLYDLLWSPWAFGFFFLAILLWGTGLRRLLNSESRQTAVWKTLLRVPVVKSVVRTICEQRLSVILVMTREAGLVSSDSLKLAADAMGNIIYRRACLQAAEKVVQGVDLPKALGQTEVFSQSFLMVLASSEEVGKLPEMLKKYSALLTGLIEENLKAAIPLIQPFLLGGLAVLVLFFAFSVLQPLNQLIVAL